MAQPGMDAHSSLVAADSRTRDAGPDLDTEIELGEIEETGSGQGRNGKLPTGSEGQGTSFVLTSLLSTSVTDTQPPHKKHFPATSRSQAFSLSSLKLHLRLLTSPIAATTTLRSRHSLAQILFVPPGFLILARYTSTLTMIYTKHNLLSRTHPGRLAETTHRSDLVIGRPRKGCQCLYVNAS